MPTAAMRRPAFGQGAHPDELPDGDDAPVFFVGPARVPVHAMAGRTPAAAGPGIGQVAGEGRVALATPRLLRLARRTGMDPDSCVAGLRALPGDGQPSLPLPGGEA